MRRTTIEIMAEMLGLCIERQSKTRVMYGSNLTWGMTNEYLSFLLSQGFLTIHHSPTKYEVTEKGGRFLEKWKEIKELLVHEP